MEQHERETWRPTGEDDEPTFVGSLDDLEPITEREPCSE